MRRPAAATSIHEDVSTRSQEGAGGEHTPGHESDDDSEVTSRDGESVRLYELADREEPECDFEDTDQGD